MSLRFCNGSSREIFQRPRNLRNLCLLHHMWHALSQSGAGKPARRSLLPGGQPHGESFRAGAAWRPHSKNLSSLGRRRAVPFPPVEGKPEEILRLRGACPERSRTGPAQNDRDGGLSPVLARPSPACPPYGGSHALPRVKVCTPYFFLLEAYQSRFASMFPSHRA